MTFHIIQVSDTVTYRRTATLIVEGVEGESEDEACDKAYDRANDGELQWDEVQVDTTPYEAIPLATDSETTPSERMAAKGLPELLEASRRQAGLDGDEREVFERYVRDLSITDDEIGRFNNATWNTKPA